MQQKLERRADRDSFFTTVQSLVQLVQRYRTWNKRTYENSYYRFNKKLFKY